MLTARDIFPCIIEIYNSQLDLIRYDLIEKLEYLLQQFLPEISDELWRELVGYANFWQNNNERFASDTNKHYAAATIYRLAPVTCASKTKHYRYARALYKDIADRTASLTDNVIFIPAAYHCAKMASMNLGNSLEERDNISRNHSLASRYFHRACFALPGSKAFNEKYHTLAQYELDRLYTQGLVKDNNDGTDEYLRLFPPTAKTPNFSFAIIQKYLVAFIHSDQISPHRDYFLRASNKADIEGIIALANYMLTKAKYEKAWRYFSYAARRDFVDARVKLGQMAEFGLHQQSGEPDYSLAVEHYQRAFRHDYAPAYLFLASLQQRGLIESERGAAEENYRKANKLGSVEAGFQLTRLSTNSPDRFRLFVLQGSPAAIYYQAVLCFGIKLDPLVEFKKRIERAKAYNYLPARLKSIQLESASDWDKYLKQIELGTELARDCVADPLNHDSAFILGQLHEKGWLRSGQNHSLALSYYQKGARSNNPDCLARLAYFYQHGLGGLEPDKEEAERLTGRACRLNSHEAKEIKHCEEDILALEQSIKTDPPNKMLEGLLSTWYQWRDQRVLVLFLPLLKQQEAQVKTVKLCLDLIILFSDDATTRHCAMLQRAELIDPQINWHVFKKIFRENPNGLERVSFLRHYLSHHKNNFNHLIVSFFCAAYQLSEQEQRLLADHCKPLVKKHIARALDEALLEDHEKDFFAALGYRISPSGSQLTDQIRFLDLVVVNPNTDETTRCPIHRLIASHRKEGQTGETKTLREARQKLLSLIVLLINAILNNDGSQREAIPFCFTGLDNSNLEDESQRVAFLQQYVCPSEEADTLNLAPLPYIAGLLRRLANDDKKAAQVLKQYQDRCNPPSPESRWLSLPWHNHQQRRSPLPLSRDGDAPANQPPSAFAQSKSLSVV